MYLCELLLLVCLIAVFWTEQSTNYCREQEKGIASKHVEQLYEGFENERIQPEKCCVGSEVSD
jgi:hypothetical protein